MAATERVFIDLTSDDDNYEIKVIKLGGSVLTAPAVHRQPLLAHKGQQLPQHIPQPGNVSRPSPRNDQLLSSNHNLNAERSLRTTRNGFVEPPAKRQCTSLVGKHDLEAQLVRFVKGQLFPRITEITENLARTYEKDHTVKLEYTIWCRIRSRIEAQWYQQSGKLSQRDEVSLYAEIRRLVIELKDHPDRLASPPPARELRSIIPSIETDPIRSNSISSTRLENASLTVVKDEEEQDISVLADDGADIRTAITKIPKRRVPKADALPVPRPRPPKEASIISPLRLRARAKAKQWQSGKAVEDGAYKRRSSKGSGWFALSSRPYLPKYLRQNILGQDHQLYLEGWELQRPSAVHVDFSKSEVDYLQYVARELFGCRTQVRRDNINDLRHLLKKAKKLDKRHEVLQAHETRYHGFDTPPAALLSRSVEDLDNYMVDLHNRRLRPGAPQIFSARREELDAKDGESTISRIPSLLLAREVLGNNVFGSIRRYENFTTAFKASHEDTLEPQIEWTNCAGDIMTLIWVSDTQFICGTTTHSDAHNQQYNKPGNLLLGSTQGSLRAYPDHRIPRPVVSSGENSLDSMVESQDPWLFTSVVDADYDPVRKLAYTASFDNTVKVWQVREDNTMKNVATWPHKGRVNFVLASKHPAGLVATAADVRNDAVAVYQVGTPYDWVDHYSCTQVHDQDNVPSEKWAYCPAAIRWGLAPDTQHLLLVGYSPRSFTGDDRNIPEDKLTTGELCVWNTLEKSQVKVNSVATQNVFEVVWHPSRNSFAVATSKTTSAERADSSVRTQIRIFELNAEGQYGAIKTLDCPAIDINELILRPNSLIYSYVAAGCTDGNVYVWDTAGSDRPMCVLEHGEPVEEFLGEKEMEDVGVKFIAWGTTTDRLYTGSSDGVVKVWNIRHGKSVHLRDLIEVPGPITTGAFSPDHTRLVIGDGSGRVCLLSLEAMEENNTPSASTNGLIRMQVQGRQKAIRRPRPFIPHPDIPTPGDSGSERARGYLERGEILVHANPCIGAVQGSNYASTQLFRAEAHLDGDVEQPLLAEFEREQQVNTRFAASCRILRIHDLGEIGDLNQQTHSQDSAWLGEDTRAELEADGVEIYSDYDFEYESGDDPTSEEEEMY